MVIINFIRDKEVGLFARIKRVKKKADAKVDREDESEKESRTMIGATKRKRAAGSADQ